MTILESVHAKEVIANNVRLLRKYATRSVLQGCALKPEEEHQHMRAMAELREKFGGFGVTEKELIQLVLKGLISQDEPCGCDGCQGTQPHQDLVEPVADTFDPDGLSQ